MTDRVAAIRAAIEALEEGMKLAKLEKAFVKKKLDGKLTKKDRENLSAARTDYRLNHRQPTTGAAVGSIGAEAKQGKVG